MGDWPSQRPTFAGRRGAAVQKVFDELLQLRMVQNLRDERAVLRRGLRNMMRGLRVMSARAEHVRTRAEHVRTRAAPS